ncbi:voltage-dependent calcium channel subunit alpha-2/delta-3 isoform X2 [Cephus cinctus]|uniref:Voltage-dependent calcium channel subunit alpha-2/delta-3 isoform X2 n=1 Tax=Cephus cinctus TaxID=211228 RepID=A0AAJ7BJW1_CEPCN|nr:voltage-dependent calcium channel subunit alpha-2/delta-3 isoform X2 [Cephus cinctus]
MLRVGWTKWLVLIIVGTTLANDAQIVDQWAETLGKELWELANTIARPADLKDKYKDLNARVENKSGEELISIISENVGRMLRRKMDAVRRILSVAEDAAEYWNVTESEDFSYVSGKYSQVEKEPTVILPKTMKNDSDIYRNITLTPDSHFYNIPVNTSFSSVHVPTNIYDRIPEVKKAIRWSEALDDVFRQNYRSDPALSWQYFGSTTGILRQYPAMQWRTAVTPDGSPDVDLYDCRVRSWYIEAATCSKDMVILLDTSGSMAGMGITIAKKTVAAILETLSNNDFVTVLTYANETREVVPCFKDKLVQATPENVDTFIKSIDNIKPMENGNLTDAFISAFSLLETYRDKRGCNSDTPCNQLIMLITDGVPGNLTEVFTTWNWCNNNTYIPVRVFTYLLGLEVTNVREIQWMACLNRGYYVHVHSLQEIQEQVLKYIPVVARPLVLQGKEHPVVWTHAYADISLGKDESVHEDPSTLNTTTWQEYRLLTSVSIPAFDRKGNRNNETRVANLLGVAGTDVPIEYIRKLTLPYKLGVNGYAFIVSNNGYVILHPDLRPVYKGRLKLNYNSIDLTEVEILDDNRGPRNPSPKLLELREALVNHTSGSMLGIPVKLHYDDNRRVTLEKRNYFYAPLPGTPFEMAVTLPDYGTTWIKVGDEIQRNINAQINISSFFIGDRWRVHPGWVYCRFHYLEGHEFESPEQELRHFLGNLGKPGWRWSDQYEEYEIGSDMEENDENLSRGRQTLKDDDYYCNKELMQLLVFDANATNGGFSGKFSHTDASSEKLAKDYQIFLRFVATQSGLTRWQNVDEAFVPKENDEDAIEFGDLHRRAVNEPWYKGAIFQHNIDSNSISLTVPWEAGPNATVTVSLGIFPKDGGNEAPAAVIGFQMPMTALYARFIDITSKSTNPKMNCNLAWIDCYLIDQNGYVVISEAHYDTGQFLGTLEGAIMNSMIHQGLYKAVELYDYQALCSEINIVGAASVFSNPFGYVRQLIGWFLIRLSWFAAEFVDLPGVFAKPRREEEKVVKPEICEVLETYPCDQKRTLYIMNQTIGDSGITNVTSSRSRPFFAEKVQHTNLLLVVIDTMHWSDYIRLSVLPEEISPFTYTDIYDTPCHKIPLNDLPRRRLSGCFTDHPLEYQIKACGQGSKLELSLLLLFATIFTILCKFV